MRRPPRSTRTDPRFPYTTLVRSLRHGLCPAHRAVGPLGAGAVEDLRTPGLEQLAALDGDVVGQDHLQVVAAHLGDHGERDRSEEHTSELQSLMRISYAVFCLKKKQNKQT